jgi:lysophospholipase L1-like esterase
MARLKIGLLILLCVCPVVAARQKEQPNRWEQAIRTFEDWDSKNSFPSNAVLFVGSSSIRMWPTRECFTDLPVINRGFGGSQISDVIHYVKRIVLRYAPKVVVFYAGDNDVAAGKSAQRVFNDYKAFTKLVRANLPQTRIIFISIKPSPSRWSLWPVMKRANRMIRDFSSRDARLFYFDGAAPLLGGDGLPKAALFRPDKLHLNPKGYALWTRLLRPTIDEALKPDRK